MSLKKANARENTEPTLPLASRSEDEDSGQDDMPGLTDSSGGESAAGSETTDSESSEGPCKR